MKKISHILLSMLVPLLMVGLVSVIAYIFCGVGLTSNDCFEQYIPFFSVYYDILTEGDSIFYSLTGALGYDFWSVFSYYLVCPLNLIILLFGKARIIYAVQLLIMLKIALSGGSFAAFLKNRFPSAKTNRIVLFSTIYALSGFVVGYAWNVMWLDGIVLFPLVIMGMDILMREHNPKWYIYTLFLSMLIICCYFMGYMSCIFIFMYFFTYNFKSFGDFAGKLLRIGLSSLLALGISGIILIPAFWGLQSTYISGESMPGPKLYGSFVNCFKTMMIGVPQNGINFDRENANMFITVLGFLLSVVYFTTGSIKVSDKIRKVLLLLVLFFSFNFKPLNYIWHGMHEQSGIPNRFSFMAIFLMLVMGFEVCMQKKNSVKKSALFAGWGIVTVSCAVMAVFDTELIIHAVLTSVLALAYVFILGFAKGKIKFNVIRIFAFLEVFITFCVGMFFACGTIQGDYDYYLEDFEQIKSQQEPGFYREKLDYTYNEKEEYFENKLSCMSFEEFSFDSIMDYCSFMKNIGHLSVINEGTYYGLNCPSLFNTFHNYNLSLLYYKIGGTGGTNNAMYYGENPFMDMIMGIRYHYVRYFDVKSTTYEFEKTVGEVNVYRNKYALSVGYAIPDEFAADMELYDNPFTSMNSMSRSICDGNVFYLNTFKHTDSNEEELKDIFEYDVTVTGELLVELSNGYTGTLIIKTDGKEVYSGTGTKQMISLGVVKAGQKVTVETDREDFEWEKEKNISIYSGTLNAKVFEEVYKELSDNQMEVKEYGSDYLKGSIYLPEASKVMVTIPCGEGFSVYVDGEEAEYDTYRNL
ncbi:MAG: YfhO family protein, partial [Butyrivibrio sp.]